MGAEHFLHYFPSRVSHLQDFFMSSCAVFLSTPRTRYKDSPDVESERCLCCSAITRTHTHTPSLLTSHNHLLSLKEKGEKCDCYTCCMRLYVSFCFYTSTAFCFFHKAAKNVSVHMLPSQKCDNNSFQFPNFYIQITL